jgi:hypothetical protein
LYLRTSNHGFNEPNFKILGFKEISKFILETDRQH